MNPAEVVVHIVKGNRSGVILNLFGKCVGQSGEAAYGHSHREVLAFNKTGADVFAIRAA